MGFDAFLKRYYPFALCALLGVAAYFQAVGITELVAASISEAPALAPAPLLGKPPPGSAPGDERAKSGQPILARNPFDSVTGSLEGEPLGPLPIPMGTGQKGDSENPFNDPKCDAGRVLIIMSSEDPQWSFATFQTGDGKTQARRMGDDVGSQKVFFVGGDRVWMTNVAGTRCQLKLWSKEEGKPESEAAKKPKKSSSKVQEDIISKIEKISDTEFKVDRSVIGQIIENQTELMRTARINPEKQGDKVVGLKLNGIRPNSLLSHLGMQNNDQLQSINGVELSDPQKLLEVYAKLPQLSHVTTTLSRGGKTINLDFQVK